MLNLESKSKKKKKKITLTSCSSFDILENISGRKTKLS